MATGTEVVVAAGELAVTVPLLGGTEATESGSVFGRDVTTDGFIRGSGSSVCC